MAQAIKYEELVADDIQVSVPKLERSVAVPQKTSSVLHITTTDPAGAGFNLCQALQRHTEWNARILTTQPNVYGHPEDIGTVYDYYDELEQLLLDADVVHFHKITEDFEISLPLTSSRKRTWQVKDFIRTPKNKNLIYHVHGHPYERANPEENGKQYAARGARVLTSTPDLATLYAPHCRSEYFPNCVPQDDLLYVPRGTTKKLRDSKGTERWIVAHSVSVPSLKNVAHIEEAVRRVADKYPVNYLQLKDMPFSKTMKIKRHSSVVFDHMQGYYGLGSLEGFSLGKPVICGLDGPNLAAVQSFWGLKGSGHPWIIARDLETLEDSLEYLLEEPGRIEEHGKQGREFIENVWSDRNVATRLADIYRAL